MADQRDLPEVQGATRQRIRWFVAAILLCGSVAFLWDHFRAPSARILAVGGPASNANGPQGSGPSSVEAETVLARVDDHRTSVEPGQPAAPDDSSLQGGTRLSIRVVELATSNGIPGATVKAEHDEVEVAATDGDGGTILKSRLDFDRLLASSLIVSAPGYAPACATIRGEHHPSSPLVVQLRPESVLVVVARASSNLPLADASIRVSAMGMDFSDTPGKFSAGRHVQMRRDPVLQGYRRIGGFGEHVWTEPVGSDGRATVRGLPCGAPLHVRLIEGGFVHDIPLKPPALLPGEVREISWNAPASGTVEGLVVDPSGAPRGGIHLVLVPNPTSAIASLLDARKDVLATTQSGPDGRFRFERVPFGDYLCGPSAKKHSVGMMVARRALISDHSDRVTLELRSDASCMISGIVILNGTASQNVQVVARRTDAEGSLTAACTPQSGYSFKLGPLECAEYRLQAIGDRGEESDPVEWRIADPDPVLIIQGK